MTLSAYTSHTIRFMSIAVVLLLINGSAVAQSSLAMNPSLPPGESERIDAFLQAYYSGVIVTKTATNSFGQTLSCVDIQHQPALNNPALTSHQIQLQPSPELRAILPYNVKEDDTLSPCPNGSVGMILPTREQIVRAGSLKNFRSKYPDGSEGRLGVEPNFLAPPANTGHGHETATSYWYGHAIGAQSTFNVWTSAIESPGEFSLTQMWVIGWNGGVTQSVEVGVNVYPQLYGDNFAHLFVYFTPDSWGPRGCYNTLCGNDSFTQTSNIAPGMILPGSTSGGTQVEGTLAFYRDPATGNWILFFFDGTAYIQVGYYRAGLFGSGQMSQYALSIEFGGEVLNVHTSRHSNTDMGSGRYPEAGYGYAAYQRNLLYMDAGGTIHNFQGTTYARYPDCYDVAPGTNPSWGSSIYFGGPGFRTYWCDLAPLP